MNYGCEGKVAFISGGTSGIGKAVAELLLKDGAEVWLLGRDAEKGTEAAVTLSAYGKVHYVQGDVKDLEACRSAAQNVREQRENIDLIVNAAGIYQERRLEKVTEYDFFSIMDTNVKGTIFLTQTLLPLLAAEGASIVNIASDAGINGNYGCPLYCASKGAVVAFTKALALDRRRGYGSTVSARAMWRRRCWANSCSRRTAVIRWRMWSRPIRWNGSGSRWRSRM